MCGDPLLQDLLHTQVRHPQPKPGWHCLRWFFTFYSRKNLFRLCEFKIFVVCWHLNEIIPRRSKLTAILLPSSPPSVLGSKPMWASAVVPLVPLWEASPSVSSRSRWESAERVGSKGDPGAQTCTRSSSQSLVTSCGKYKEWQYRPMQHRKGGRRWARQSQDNQFSRGQVASYKNRKSKTKNLKSR